MEIRTLKPDEKISEAGFYAISLERHHSQPCVGPSVTSGVLRKMELQTPADVWAFHKLNPDRWEQEDKTALRLGRAMAAYVEGGMDMVAKHFVVLPKDKPNRATDDQIARYEELKGIDLDAMLLLPDDRPRRPTQKQVDQYEAGTATDTARASVEFWNAIDQSGKTPVTPSELEQLKALKQRVEFWREIEKDPRAPLTDAEQTMIENMGKVLAKDAGAAAAMSGIPEVTMAWKDERTGLWLLARPDTVNFDGTVTDFKKINTQGRPFTPFLVDRRIEEHAYYMQLGFAAEVFEKLTGEWPGIAAIVAQWDQAPHHVILRDIPEEDLRIGQWRNRRAIDRFAECLASGYWPGPGEVVGSYLMSSRLRETLIAEMNTENAAP